jgi:hypothetical protein
MAPCPMRFCLTMNLKATGTIDNCEPKRNLSFLLVNYLWCFAMMTESWLTHNYISMLLEKILVKPAGLFNLFLNKTCSCHWHYTHESKQYQHLSVQDNSSRLNYLCFPCSMLLLHSKYMALIAVSCFDLFVNYMCSFLIPIDFKLCDHGLCFDLFFCSLPLKGILDVLLNKFNWPKK